MPRYPDRDGRRAFLRHLAASPLLAMLGVRADDLARLLTGPARDVVRELESLTALAQQGGAPIRTPDQALNVMEFEAAAQAALPPAHFGYLASGVDDDATLRANREDFARWQIRARRLIDVRRIDTSVELLGRRWETPIVICPCGSQKAFHQDGEIASARAARARGHLQILSGVTTVSVEEVSAARGEPVWFQLYPTDDVDVGLAIVRRAAAAGCPVLVLTVDLNAGRNLETQLRSARLDDRACADCHPPGFAARLRRKPMFDGLDLSRATVPAYPGMTWDYVARVRDVAPSMKVVLKGIVTREDALLAVRHGADAVVVSNHGGRAEESGRSSIACLPEVAAAVGRRLPVLFDGGVRRGTDVFKAIALGARAVGIGRPYLWGLAAFGEAGVGAVLAILRRELELVMQQAGTTTVGRIGPDALTRHVE